MGYVEVIVEDSHLTNEAYKRRLVRLALMAARFHGQRPDPIPAKIDEAMTFYRDLAKAALAAPAVVAALPAPGAVVGAPVGFPAPPPPHVPAAIERCARCNAPAVFITDVCHHGVCCGKQACRTEAGNWLQQFEAAQ